MREHVIHGKIRSTGGARTGRDDFDRDWRPLVGKLQKRLVDEGFDAGRRNAATDRAWPLSRLEVFVTSRPREALHQRSPPADAADRSVSCIASP
jgi:hypothetical protein